MGKCARISIDIHASGCLPFPRSQSAFSLSPSPFLSLVALLLVISNAMKSFAIHFLEYYSVTLTEMMTMMPTRINVVIVTRTGAAEGWMTVVDLYWRLRLPAKCDVCGVKGIGMGRWGRKKAGG